MQFLGVEADGFVIVVYDEGDVCKGLLPALNFVAKVVAAKYTTIHE
jgi:hypothetical protein